MNNPFSARPRFGRFAGAALIALAAVVAYWPALGGGFVLDDDILLTDSQLVRSPDGLYRFWFTTEPRDYWPVTNSSFWLEWRLWGMNPAGYHATNLILHVASALLIWAILSKLSIPGAWLAALLFAVHPVNVQSVAWIAQRKNTLSMLFFLVSILWYSKGDPVAEKGTLPFCSADSGKSGQSPGWYWLSLLAFVLAMLSKGSVAIGPIVLLMLAWWQRGRVGARDLLRAGPFFVVAAVLTAVNVWFQTHGGEPAARIGPLLERLLGAGAVIWFYLFKALAPVNLAFIYPQWNIETDRLVWWLPLLAAVAVTAVLVLERHRRWVRPLLFAWGFFCVALVPVMGFTYIGFMKYSLVSDHYLHIAIVGVLALVAAGFKLWQGRAPVAAPVTAALVASLLGVLTFRQCRLYEDPVTLYEATLAKNPGSWQIHSNLGSAVLQRRQGERAIEHFQQAIRLNPGYSKGHYNLGVALAGQGRTQEAIGQYREALRLRPDAETHNNLGTALAKQGQMQEAMSHFEQAVQLAPDSSTAHYNLASALAQTGQLAGAVEHYEQALRLAPGYWEAHQNLGRILEQSDRPLEAIQHYQFVAAAYARAGRLPDAIALTQRCLNLARASGQAGLADQIEERLRNYRSGGAERTNRP